MKRTAVALTSSPETPPLITAVPSEKNLGLSLRIAANGLILWANLHAEPLLSAWKVRVGQRVPPAYLRLVLETLKRKQIKKVSLKVNRRTYACSFAPNPKHACVDVYALEFCMGCRARKELQTIRGRLELLAKTAGLLLRAEDPQAAIDGICKDVMAELGCEYFFNYLVHEPGKRLRLNAYAGIPPESAKAIEFLDFGAAICGTVAKEGQRIILCDLQKSNNAQATLVRSYGVQAYCCHPLMAEGRVIGTISFGSSKRNRFDLEEVGLMKTVSDYVAVAVQRAQAKDALRSSEERFRLLAEAMPQLAWIAKGDGTPGWHNRGWQNYCGTSSAGTKTWDSEEVHDEQVWPRAQTRWRQSLSSGNPFEMILPLRGKDGRCRRFLVRIQPVKDSSGGVTQWLGTATDVDELKRGEEQLEQRVLERTAQLRALAGELTQSEERERMRIAKILHDDLQQLLVAAKFHLDICKSAISAKPALEGIRQTKDLVNQAINVARDLSHDLSLVVLHEEGLSAALKWLAKWMEQNHLLTVRIRCESSPP